MGKRRADQGKQELILQGFTGVNQAQDPEMIDDTELAALYNMSLTKTEGGNIAKIRGGYTPFNTNALTGAPLSLVDVVDKAGNDYLLAKDSSVLKKSSGGTGSWSNIKTGLAANPFKIAGMPDGQYVITNNSDRPYIIYGTAFASNINLELIVPNIFGVQSSHKSGGNMKEDSLYKYVLVYETETGAYSPPSVAHAHHITKSSNKSTDSTSKQIALSAIPSSSDTRVKSVRIYRTKGTTVNALGYTDPTTGATGQVYGYSQDIYYHLTTIKNGETTFFDSTPDEDLDVNDAVQFIEAPIAEYVLLHKGRLFFGNVTINDKFLRAPYFSNGATSPPSGYTAGARFEADNSTNTSEVGGLDANAEYQWMVLYVSAEGKISDYVETPVYTDVTGTDFKITLKNIPSPGSSGSDIDVAYMKLYRTEGDGSTYYHVVDLPLYAEQYEDSTGDASLGAAYSAPGTQNFPNALMYSNPLKYEEFPFENIINIFPSAAEEITGMIDDRDGILIFTTSKIYKLYTEGAPSNWRVIIMSQNIGCTDSESLVAHNNNIYFVSNKKLYLYSNGRLEYLSSKFEASMELITTFWSACYFEKLNWYVMYINAGGAMVLYVYDERIGTFYTHIIDDALNSITGRGIIEKRYGSNAKTLVVYFNCSTGTDGLYKYNESVNYDISSDVIQCYLRTKTFRFPYYIRPRILHFLYKPQIPGASMSLQYSINGISDGAYSNTGSKTIEKDEIEEKITDAMFNSSRIEKTQKVYFEIGDSTTSKSFTDLRLIKLTYRILRRGFRRV